MSKNFFKNARLLAVTETLLKLKALIVIPLLTRHFGPLNYGIWGQVNILSASLLPLVVLGTDSGAIRFLPGLDLEEKKKSYLGWLCFLALSFLVMLVAISIFRNQVANFFFGQGSTYASFALIAMILLFTNLFLDSSRTWFRLNNFAKVFASVSIFQAVISFVSILIVYILRLDVKSLIFMTAGGDFVIALSLIGLFAFKFGLVKPNLKIIPKILRYGLPLMPIGYAMWGLNSMDRIFLARYSNLNEIGVYALVYSLGYSVIQVFVSPLYLMFPNTAAELFDNGSHLEISLLFQRTFLLICGLTFPCVAGLIVLGRPALLLLTTPAFVEGATIIPIITVGYVFHVLASFYDVLLGLVHRQYISTVSFVIAFVVNFVLNLVLIPRYFILGAAWATSIAFAIQFLFSLSFWAWQRHEIKGPQFPGKMFISAVLMLLILTFLKTKFNPTYWVGLISYVLIGTAIYAVSLFALRDQTFLWVLNKQMNTLKS
jgi:O-antigen/teichoic acid export membrane protein